MAVHTVYIQDTYDIYGSQITADDTHPFNRPFKVLGIAKDFSERHFFIDQTCQTILSTLLFILDSTQSVHMQRYVSCMTHGMPSIRKLCLISLSKFRSMYLL